MKVSTSLLLTNGIAEVGELEFRLLGTDAEITTVSPQFWQCLCCVQYHYDTKKDG